MEIWGYDLTALLPFIAIGFFAQLVDGALGMAFGVISNLALLWMGVPPAVATKNVHIIKVFTGAASGLSHIVHGNVDWKLFAKLSVTGVIGGVAGAHVLSAMHLKDANFAVPFVFGYLVLVGIFILWRGLGHKVTLERKAKVVAPFGLIGGFLDATGGGGWGPVVTSNLLAQGNSPRKTIGTVNAAEFVLAVAVTITFINMIGFGDLHVAVVGLLIGGVAAAPLASRITRHVPAKWMMIAVGVLLIATSLLGIVRHLSLV